MTNNSSFSKNVSILLIRDVLGYFLSFLLFPLVSKMLGPIGLGEWSQFNLALLLITTMLSLNLGHAYIRFSSGFDVQESWKNLNSIVITSTASYLIIAVLLFPFQGIISSSFFSGDVTNIVFFILIAGYGRTLFGQISNYFKVINNFKTFSLIIFVMSLIEILLLLLVLSLTKKILYAFIILSFDYLIVGTCIYIYFIRKFGFTKYDKAQIKQYLKFGLPVLPAALGFWAVNSSNRFIISSIQDISQTGVFSASFSLASLGLFFMGAISNALGVEVSSKFNNNMQDEAINLLSKTLKLVLLLLIPFFVGLSIFAKEILLLLTTKEFVDVGIVLVPILNVGILSYIIYQFHAYIFDLFKKTKITGIIWMTIGTLSIFLNIYLITKWGSIGAAIGTTFSFIGVFITSVFFSRKYAILFRDNIIIVKSIFSSLIMIVFISLIPYKDSITGLILIAVFGFSIYVTVMLIIKGITAEELLLAKQFSQRVFLKKRI